MSVIELDLSSVGAPGTYRVQIIQSPAGEASATFAIDPDEFLRRLEDFQQTLLASSVKSRRLLSRGESSVREMGRRLFDALFAQRTLAEVYRASCAVAVERGEPLRMVLRVNAPELAALPWEAMFDQTLSSYVCRREPLVRYLPVASSPPPMAVRPPLRILAVVASPRGLAALDTEKEKDDLTTALARPIARGLVVVHWLEQASWPALQDTLLSDSWHVVHFIGHGDFDADRDEGVLALETEDGRVHRVAAEHVVDLLREAHPMPRLVVLNACESSASGTADMFSGTAAALVRGGVSAVTAMQFQISDSAAIAFCRGFYTAIVQGRGIDEAVRSGRVAILGLGGDSLEWITPTLFLRGRETHLFSIPAGVLPDARPSAPDKKGKPEKPETPEPASDNKVVEAEILEEAGDEQKYPDRLAEIWSVAKRIGWFDRPLKSDLTPLTNVLPPEERIVGCPRVALGTASGCGALITDRHLYLSTSSANNVHWRMVLMSIPAAYHVASDVVRLPLPRSAEVLDGHLTVTINDAAPLPLTSYDPSKYVEPIKKYLAEAHALPGRT